jgi:hypothetical protein
MASILEILMGPIKALGNLLNSPLATVVLIAIGVFVIGGLYLYNSLKPSKKIVYLHEAEHQGEFLPVINTTPNHYHSKRGKDPYEFVRFREPYTITSSWKTTTYIFAKSGSAYTKDMEFGEKGPFTLWQIMQGVWGVETCEALLDEQKQKLIESKVAITVKLEPGFTPEGLKERNEFAIQKEADAQQAQIFGINLKKQLNKEDYIKYAGLVGTGVALALVGQAMGLIGTFG